MVALAPHGGYVEDGTDAQACRLADRLGATARYCAGWWPGGGAFDRWHVTSTALLEDIRDAVGRAVGGVDVRLAGDPARDGSSIENVVNWIAEAGGVPV